MATAPVIDGWFATDDAGGHLIGLSCSACSTIVFPPTGIGCPNPHCTADADAMSSVPLSRSGKVWSYVTNHYRPPAPFRQDGDDFTPYSVVAVELADEAIVVLGQLADAVDVATIRVGTPVTLEIAHLYTDDEGVSRQVWKWRPVDGGTDQEVMS